ERYSEFAECIIMDFKIISNAVQEWAEGLGIETESQDETHIKIRGNQGSATVTAIPEAPFYKLETRVTPYQNKIPEIIDRAVKEFGGAFQIKVAPEVLEPMTSTVRPKPPVKAAPKPMGFRKAERKQAKLRLGISGTSGSGKTASSLLIAYGITGDWSKVGLIDTENGSGDLYVGSTIGGVLIGDYNVLTLSAPYSPEKYVQAIKLAEEGGMEVVIVDSLTHAWTGAGGILEQKDSAAAASASGNSYVAWRNVTPRHNALVDAMLTSKIHVIATLRAKQEYVQEKDERGKTTIKKVGLAPIQRDGMEYEFTTFLDIERDHTARASKDRTNIFDLTPFTPTPAIGQKLLGWINCEVA
ncbi:MAG TPA: AAA family ATPase, partial [Methanotrichaceae archaeon]|nr:AAA family ATPase [Methanotrichaceae archaeon]